MGDKETWASVEEMMGEEEDAEITDTKEATVDASSDAPGIRPSVPNGDLRQGLLAPAVPIQTASTFGRRIQIDTKTVYQMKPKKMPMTRPKTSPSNLSPSPHPSSPLSIVTMRISGFAMGPRQAITHGDISLVHSIGNLIAIALSPATVA
jgi:hypothetical protein